MSFFTRSKRFFVSSLLALSLGLSTASFAGEAPQAGMPSMVVEHTVKHDYGAALDTVRQQLKGDGWNLIAEIDLGKRLAKKGVGAGRPGDLQADQRQERHAAVGKG